VVFSCRVDEEGKDVVCYDMWEVEDPGWSQYFDEASLNSKPGQTYPSNLKDRRCCLFENTPNTVAASEKASSMDTNG
jgi:hypothetical protein